LVIVAAGSSKSGISNFLATVCRSSTQGTGALAIAANSIVTIQFCPTVLDRRRLDLDLWIGLSLVRLFPFGIGFRRPGHSNSPFNPRPTVSIPGAYSIISAASLGSGAYSQLGLFLLGCPFKFAHSILPTVIDHWRLFPTGNLLLRACHSKTPIQSSPPSLIAGAYSQLGIGFRGPTRSKTPIQSSPTVVDHWRLFPAGNRLLQACPFKKTPFNPSHHHQSLVLIPV
jgi:hypothetical protein